MDLEDGDFNYKKCLQILRLLKQHPKSKPFLYPVDPVQLQIPEYY